MTTNNTTTANVFYPVANAGASSNAFVWQFLPRDPTPQDVNYPIQKFWLNTVDDTIFFLKNFITTNGIVTANWIEISTGTPLIEQFDVQTGTSPVGPLAGIVTFNGAVVPAGTNPVRTDGTDANTMALEVQISQAIAATDATNIGLAAFNSAQFTVDANGFVSLIGGSEAIDSFIPDSGTSPVVPAANGSVTMSGSGSTTTVGGLNTLTFQLTGLTNHNVLIGAGTTTITKVAPSATTGVPLISQGSSADPAFGTASIAGGGTNATSFTQTNGIVTYNGTSLVNYAGPQINSSGIQTNTTQPAFLATGGAVNNVLGTTTSYLLGSAAAMTEIFDQNSDFNPGDGAGTPATFTAPVTGKYYLSIQCRTGGYVASTQCSFRIITSNRNYLGAAFNPQYRSTGSGVILAFSVLADMDAGDTATFEQTASGEASDIIDIVEGTISGFLAC